MVTPGHRRKASQPENLEQCKIGGISMKKRTVLLVLLAFAIGGFANLVGAGEAMALPGGAMNVNMTLNPGAVPMNGTGMVTVSYFCNGSGCTTVGGPAALTMSPT